MNESAGDLGPLKRGPDTEFDETALKDGEPPYKRLKTEGEGIVSQDTNVPVVSSNKTEAVPSEQKAHTESKTVEAPKLPSVTRGAPRDIQEVINDNYISPADMATLSAQHKSKHPTSHTVLQDFLKEDFLRELRESLNNEDWFQQKSDICTFEQTGDLKQSTQVGMLEMALLTKKVVVKDIVHALSGTQFRQLLSGITGLNVTAFTDIFGDIYKEGSHYLCHNTGMASKRIAFFLFLGPDDWEAEDGGALELFNVTQQFQPSAVGHRIHPKLNTLVILETTPNTFYQISEVLAKDKELILISGLVRCSQIVKAKPYSEPIPQAIPASRLPTGFKLEDWINPDYLTRESLRKLSNFYEKNMSLGLNNFLLDSKYKELEAALAQADVTWQSIGPANRRHYDTLGRFGGSEGPNEIVQFKIFLRSKPFINGFLEKAIGTKVCLAHKGEVRRFKHGDYTLTIDGKDLYESDGLDLLFSFPGEATWTDDDGGCTTYLEGKDELLTLIPTKNTLSLVFREQDTTKHVKYQAASAPGTRYDIVNTFLLAVKDDDEGEDYDEGAAEEDHEDSEDEDILEDSKLGEEALQKPIKDELPEEEDEGEWDEDSEY